MFGRLKSFFAAPQHRSAFRKFFIAPLVLILLSGSCFIALGAAVKTVEINDGGTRITVTTAQNNPREILKAAGIPAGDDDIVTLTGNGSGITVNRAFTVAINCDGVETDVKAFRGQTVGDVLRAAGISVTFDKIVTPIPVTEVTPTTIICVETAPVIETVREEPEEKPVETEESREKATSAAENGAAATQPAQEKPQQAKAESPAVQPAPAGSSVAGRAVISTLVPDTAIELDAGGRPLHYKRVISGPATAYCSGTTCATGVKAQPGYIGVDPKKIPYGTKMYIVSRDGQFNYGYAIAADTGAGAKRGSIIADLRMNTREECINFGRRTIDIYILA